MFNQLYSDVGFRCESVCRALDEYKHGKQINPLIIEDSKRIIADCLRIENKSSHALFLSSSKDSEVESLLYDYILEKKDKNIIEKLKRINSSIQKLQTLEKEPLNEVYAFFGDLVAICKEKAQPLPPKNSYSKYNIVVL